MYRVFSPALKAEAYRLVMERGYSVAEAATKLGIRKASLACWLREGGPSRAWERCLAAMAQRDERVKELEERLRQLREQLPL